MTRRLAKILYVDDDALMRRAFARLVSRTFHCSLASSADEAFALIEADDFALVVTDYLLGDLTGTELIEKAAERLPSAAFVLVSGHFDLEKRAKLLPARAHFVAKPWDNRTFLDLLKTLYDAACQRTPNS